MKLPDTVQIYVASMRKLLRVTHIGFSQGDADRARGSSNDTVLVAHIDAPINDLYLLASAHDGGVSFVEAPPSKLKKAIDKVGEALDFHGADSAPQLRRAIDIARRVASEVSDEPSLLKAIVDAFDAAEAAPEHHNRFARDTDLIKAIEAARKVV